MHALNEAINNAFGKHDDAQIINKAYLEFIKANFLIPIEKNTAEPEVLFFSEDDKVFLPIFSTQEFFDIWAKDIRENIDILHLSGVDVLKGINDKIILALNIGAPIYKEFYPEELARMRSIVLKFMTKPE